MIMKKLIFLVLFFPLFSCNDWLDVESEVSVTYRNYFQSEQDIEDIFITILGNEKKIFAPLSQEPFDWTGMYCDDVADGVKGFRNLEWSAYSSSLGNYTNWGGFYSIIYLANMLEENRHRFQNVSEERINYWISSWLVAGARHRLPQQRRMPAHKPKARWTLYWHTPFEPRKPL